MLTETQIGKAKPSEKVKRLWDERGRSSSNPSSVVVVPVAPSATNTATNESFTQKHFQTSVAAVAPVAAKKNGSYFCEHLELGDYCIYVGSDAGFKQVAQDKRLQIVELKDDAAVIAAPGWAIKHIKPLFDLRRAS